MHAQPIVPSTIGQLDFFDETTRFCRDGRSVMSANPYDVTGPLLQKKGSGQAMDKGKYQSHRQARRSFGETQRLRKEHNSGRREDLVKMEVELAQFSSVITG